MLTSVLRAKGLASGILVTALTMFLIGGVLLATTSLGCGPANRVGLKLFRCSVSPIAAADLPRPTPSPINFSPSPYAPPSPTYPPDTNPASSYPPAPSPASPGTALDPFYPAVSIPGHPIHSMHCRLPIYVGQPGSGGFVLFPESSFVADPRSGVALPSPAPGSPSPATGYGGYYPGYGSASFGMTYDHLHSRWLPVKADWVAPDRNHYAYPSTNSVYLVDAASNAQIELAVGHTWLPIRVLNDRIYATIPNTPGLWVLPFSGAPWRATDQGYWQAATAGAAYGMLTSAVPQGATQNLVKLDLASGTITDWFSREGATLSIFGFDLQGNLIVMSTLKDWWVLWLTTSPSNTTVIANSTQRINLGGTAVADGHGVWFTGGYTYGYGGPSSGLLLYIRGSGLYWMSSWSGQLAGGCA